MWKFIADALRIGGQMALGYFANDVADGVGKVTGVKADSSGRYPWWFLLAILGVAGAAIYFIVNMIVPTKGKK